MYENTVFVFFLVLVSVNRSFSRRFALCVCYGVCFVCFCCCVFTLLLYFLLLVVTWRFQKHDKNSTKKRRQRRKKRRIDLNKWINGAMWRSIDARNQRRQKRTMTNFSLSLVSLWRKHTEYYGISVHSIGTRSTNKTKRAGAKIHDKWISNHFLRRKKSISIMFSLSAIHKLLLFSSQGKRTQLCADEKIYKKRKWNKIE